MRKNKHSSKKSSGILYEENRLEAYRFIQKYHNTFGVRWLLRKFGIVPNAYYNFLKNWKSGYCTQKQKALDEISSIYHEDGGVDGYRSGMECFLVAVSL